MLGLKIFSGFLRLSFKLHQKLQTLRQHQYWSCSVFQQMQIFVRSFGGPTFEPRNAFPMRCHHLRAFASWLFVAENQNLRGSLGTLSSGET